MDPARSFQRPSKSGPEHSALPQRSGPALGWPRVGCAGLGQQVVQNPGHVRRGTGRKQRPPAGDGPEQAWGGADRGFGNRAARTQPPTPGRGRGRDVGGASRLGVERVQSERRALPGRARPRGVLPFGACRPSTAARDSALQGRVLRGVSSQGRRLRGVGNAPDARRWQRRVPGARGSVGSAARGG